MLLLTQQRQVGVCLKHLPSASSQPNARYNSDTVPWQRVINSKGVISPRSGLTICSKFLIITNTQFRGTNGAAHHETALVQEGVQVDRGNLGERTVDFKVYGWFPNELPSREAEDAEADDESNDDGEDQRLFVSEQ